jgi:hypothetical protein
LRTPYDDATVAGTPFATPSDEEPIMYYIVAAMSWLTGDRMDGEMHAWALLIFGAMIPLFSFFSLVGVSRARTSRLAVLFATYPALTATTLYKQYVDSPKRTSGRRYVFPIVVLAVFSTFMCFVLMDGFHFHTSLVDTNRYYILCGPRCLAPLVTDADKLAFSQYQTGTLVVAGFAYLGWLVWTITTIFDGANASQLLPTTFNRLIYRLCAAVFIAIVVRFSFSTDAAADTSIANWMLAVAFTVGMFPSRGLEYIQRVADKFLQKPQRSEEFPLDLIQGISDGMLFRIHELGISSAIDLASFNPLALFDATGFNMTEIVDWTSQAQLLKLAQSGKYQALQAVGYRTVFDLVRVLKREGGTAAVQALCNLPAPYGLDEAQITADADYRHLLELYVALGSGAP